MTDFISGKGLVAGIEPKQLLPEWELTKTLRIMKLTAILLFAAALQVTAKGVAQEKINLSLANASLEKAFDQIEAQTGFVFIYKDETVKDKKVSIQVTNASLEQVLDICLKGQALSYRIVGKSVAIKVEKTVSYADGVAPPFIDVRGRVVNEKGEPVEGVTVMVKGGSQKTLTDKNGEFSLTTVEQDAVLVFTHVSMESFELKVSGKTELAITLRAKIRELSDVIVSVNTGYQEIPKERATGSFGNVDNELLNRKVSTSILDRLDGVTSGLIFNKNLNGSANNSAITIRGRSTIFANPNPLIVLDNFPYDGDLDNLNPNDIESVTILKDAAAASIWGVRAGNGVIVITTKKGKLNKKPQVSVNTNFTYGEKPDLSYLPQMSSSDFIDLEQLLYSKGNYGNVLNTTYQSISPVLEIILKSKNGQISASDSANQINALRQIDSRNDLKKYFYRSSLFQQHSINIKGGSSSNTYFLSAGYDRNLLNNPSNGYDRYTITANNSNFFLNDKLEIRTTLLFTNSISKSGPTYNPGQPYLDLVDDNGNALVVPSDFRQSYIDTAGGGKLLDWNYRPYDEMKTNISVGSLDLQARAGISYKIFAGLKFSIDYQFSKGINEAQTNYDKNSYFVRNIVNQFSQISSGGVVRPIPYGDIVSNTNSNYKTNYGRIQLSYDKSFNENNAVNVITGFEVKDYNSSTQSFGVYGYDKENGTNVQVDYLTNFPLYYDAFASGRITDFAGQSWTADRFRSYYLNGSYSFEKKYILSASARKDESNLFGVKSNQKGVPLWSVGGVWLIDNENFYSIPWLPKLKVRMTYGHNGNLDKSVSAYLTAQSLLNNNWNVPFATITNPPNPSLRWEKVKTFNAGVDFGIKNGILNGSIDYFIKKGVDLIGYSAIAPQTGTTQYKGNSSSTRTKGIDLTINVALGRSEFKWYSTAIFNFVKDKITEYNLKQGSNSDIVVTNFTNPLVGYPYYAIFSFPFAGLDSTGNPVGFLGGKPSTDYTGIVTSRTANDLYYNGPANPVTFGSFLNTFAYKRLNLSFNVTYKFGYYFRRTGVFAGAANGSAPNWRIANYEKRWQRLGDELTTNVPSLLYPTNSNRTTFYQYSSILVEKGDHIRLQDVRLSYDLSQFSKKTFQQASVYIYASNLGIIWRANKLGIDPDFGMYTIPNSKTISAGLNLTF